ncbi:cytochrome P450 [Sphingomonas tabacisoli]|uniref:Cytochrome P450 n=1 Tax=Sphingomonas tabacisoli TaxID=2249466 RepID=A0ABW4I206_9SPHN
MSYLARLDAVPETEKWPLLRGWLYSEPLPLFEELRRDRPVVQLPELDFCTRHADCTLILRRHNSFSVALYEPKQGDYFMAQDDTARHWREKSIMRSILDFEDIPAMRAFVGEEVARRLEDANGRIDFAHEIGRGVPVALVQHFFGFRNADPEKLAEWSYWNQQDAFHNQAFDAPGPVSSEEIIANRKKAGFALAFYLGRLVLRRTIAAKVGLEGDDPMSRLIRLSFSDALKFNLKQVLFNTGGLLIGAVETTSHATVNALEFLLTDPERRRAAEAAASNPAAFDPFVFEALRFRPAFPYFFRTATRDTVLAADTPHSATVRAGRTVLAVTHSAMFDPAAFPDPMRFDPSRDLSDAFTFGQGIHECLGRAIAAAMVPEIVRQLLLTPGLEAESAPDYGGTKVPQHWPLRFDAAGGSA